MNHIYNSQGNKLDRLYIELSSSDEVEAKMIKDIEKVQSLVDDLVEEAKELIKKELGYEIELEPYHLEGPHKGTKRGLMVNANYFPNSRLGQYSMKGAIEIKIQDIQKYKELSSDSIEFHNIKKEILRTLVHEIGHRIHHIHFNYKTVRLPREGRTDYSAKDSRENFAEAFENLILDSNLKRFLTRNTALRKVLDRKFKPDYIEAKAAKDTIPEKRKSLLTLDQICDEIGMTTKAARVKLRKSGKFSKGPAGWAWAPEDKNIDIVKKFLKGEK